MNDMLKAELFRKMFYGRQDVYGRQKISPDGKRNFHPVCSNFWSDGCHIKLNDGKHCADCGIKQYAPVTNETVIKHIKGEEQQVVYNLLLNGNVRFCAADFDYKDGKEAKGYTFEDVQKFSQALTSLGVHHYIARSTGNGFHTYIFFEDEISASKARAIVIEGFERAGFMEQSRTGVRPIPEVFPKQTSAGDNGIGNSIKTPMIEPNFAKERNCWVTIDNSMIPAELQWDYLSKIKFNKIADIEKIIADNEIPVIELISGGGRNAYAGDHGGNNVRRSGKWQAPLSGSYEKVLEGCSAIRSLMAKIDGGYSPRHDEGFALYHLAMSTADGLPIFQQRVRGWGQSDADKRQLEHSLVKNYSPWTCKTMQDKGICPHGTKCFEKKPPIVTVDGNEVVRDDLPQDQWPEPSPIRYAFSKGDDFLAKLQREAEALVEEKDISIKTQRLKSIIYRAMVFDEGQQDILKNFIVEKKIAKKGDISKLFKSADKEKSEEIKKSVKDNENIIIHNDMTFQRCSDGGYAVIRSIKGEGSVIVKISNFQIRFEKEIGLIDRARREFHGHILLPGKNIPFSISSDDMADSKKFLQAVFRAGGSNTNFSLSNAELIRLAAVAFSRKDGIKLVEMPSAPGFHGDKYFSNSVIIDKEGVHPNPDGLDLTGQAAHLDFKLMKREEMREVARPLFAFIQKLADRRFRLFGLAAIVVPALRFGEKLRAKPSFVVYGITGAGKTTYILILMRFWGKVLVYLNWGTSALSVEKALNACKDAPTLIDDYKGTNDQPAKLDRVVQHSYDGSSASKLHNDGSDRQEMPSRSYPIITAEHFVTNDASVASRTVACEVEPSEQISTLEKLRELEKLAESANGIMPYFIHYCLNHEEVIENDFYSFRQKIATGLPSTQHTVRMAGNVAILFVAAKHFFSFLSKEEIITAADADAHLREFEQHLEGITRDMLQRCSESLLYNRIIDLLRDLLASGKCYLADEKKAVGSVPGSSCVGFTKASEPDRAFLFSTVAEREIRTNGGDDFKNFKLTQVAADLLREKILIKKSWNVRDLKGDQKKVWIFTLASLGTKLTPRPVGKSSGTDEAEEING